MDSAGFADMTLGDIVTDNALRFPDVPAYRCRLVPATELPVLPSGKVDKKRLRADLTR